MPYLAESQIEEALLAQLEGLGYACLSDSHAGPDGDAPERESYGDVVLQGRLEAAVARLNPHLPPEARADAVRAVLASQSQSLVEENRRLHRALVDGVTVEYYGEDGVIRGDQARLVDLDDPDANDWLAINQFTAIENGAKRRPDVVIFVNGLPLAVIELKNPGVETATPTAAYNQLQTYKSEIPSLFRTNAVLAISDGMFARLGSLTANEERFMPWRTTDGIDIAPKTAPQMAVLIEGVFDKRRFLDLVSDFIVFGASGGVKRRAQKWTPVLRESGASAKD